MSKNQTNSILQLAKGAISDVLDIEMAKVLGNILDPNTDAQKARSITLKITLKPTIDRTQVAVSATSSSKLQPINPVQTSLHIGADISTGEIMASELVPSIPGQIDMDGSEQGESKVMVFQSKAM